jgi:hypothetical protein
MKQLSEKQRAIINKLSAFTAKDCDDAAFFRFVHKSKKKYKGEILSPEHAFFKKTDTGEEIEREYCTDFDAYKKLIIKHRMRTITFDMWKQDFEEGLLFPEEIRKAGFPEVAQLFLGNKEIMRKRGIALKNLLDVHSL